MHKAQGPKRGGSCAQVLPKLQQSGWDVMDAYTRMRNGETNLDALLRGLDPYALLCGKRSCLHVSLS